MTMTMRMSAKHLMKPYMSIMSHSYTPAAAAAAAVLYGPHHLRRRCSVNFFHVSALKYRLQNGRFRGFCSTIRATSPHHVNDPGSIDSSLMQSMESKIKNELNAESVSVKDAYGDGRHVSIVVVSSSFEGQSAVNRQRMVYKAIWEELQNTVHAVDQMITRTPTEAGEAK